MFHSKIKSFLKDYFTLTSRERKGAIVLSVLIIINIGTLVYFNFIDSDYNPVIQELKLTEDPFVDTDNLPLHKNEFVNSKDNTVGFVPNLQTFDPNTADSVLLSAIGLSNKQVQTILNYRNKGGVFYKKSDLSKIYGLSDETYKILDPYIEIQERETRKFKVETPKLNRKKNEISILLNSSDSSAFQKLPMVGTSRARMICRYRTALGGFVAVSQLLEVYTIDTAVYTAITPHIIFDAVEIKKVNINSDSLYHPYINNQLKRAIKAYRKQHGNLKETTDLKKIKIIEDELYNKLVPYVGFE